MVSLKKISGTELKPNDEFFTNLDKENLTLIKVGTITRSKTGKHGAAKVLCNGINVRTGNNTNIQIAGEVEKMSSKNLFYIPIYGIAFQDKSTGLFTEFYASSNYDKTIHVNMFSRDSRSFLNFFFDQFPELNGDEICTKVNGHCLMFACYEIKQDDVDKFLVLNDIVYVPESNFNENLEKESDKIEATLCGPVSQRDGYWDIFMNNKNKK
ncbi:hypothetical protein A0H76_635 [Hepatospora eriocheir]|uniref:Uncharacterized protein n=1 Tax=Hepatospora eriocheir TaxID=1081669 RepID=A0A1X0QIG9_9MICR|nr:hypothetical protein HERIO_1834 [Hepatospora eriocheir]ORD99562.1 hypothetical protein A0H76_635 [Hepatospora eriocheir]